MTRFKGEPYSKQEMVQNSLPVKNGFYWTERYPFIIGDIVVDPLYSDKIVWTCINSYRCTIIEPSLDVIEDIENTWSFQAGVVVNIVPAPAQSNSVACTEFDDKSRADDIGKNLFWCDQGRVYQCTEKAVANLRPKCSSQSPRFSIDGRWSILRATGKVTR